MADLQRAIEIAVAAHQGQLRRNGTPYVLHPMRVMLNLTTPLERIVGILHDVVEDSNWSIADLQAEGFTSEVLEAVQALTKAEREDYQVYLARIQPNSLARAVKLADLRDNMNSLELPEISQEHCQRLQKYHAAYQLLSAGGE